MENIIFQQIDAKFIFYIFLQELLCMLLNTV